MTTAVDFITRALADEVRGAVRRENFTQAQIAERTGMSLATVQRLLAGKRDMDTTQLAMIAYVLSVEPADLLRSATLRAERMSEASPDNVVTLKPRRVEDMTVDEIERQRHAATVDPEMDEPEQFD